MRHRYHPDAVPTVKQSPYVVSTIQPHPHLIVEVGCGKGQFLINQALNNPNKYFVGIEQSAQALYRAVLQAEDHQLTNIAFIWGNIDEVLDGLPSPIETMYLLFSDPWPKVRHEKRRLTTRERLERYAHHGVQQLIIKTDNPDLFTYSKAMINQSAFTLIYSGEAPFILGETTEFEDKYRRLQKPIYQLEAKV
jgi:tRNA (guanine-N7-)-methyltransferase